jgi:hypothetical protein
MRRAELRIVYQFHPPGRKWHFMTLTKHPADSTILQIPSTEFQNVSVVGTIHSNLGNVNSVKPLPPKDRGCMRS